MIEYLIHAYKAGTQPFQSLSALPDEVAIQIMQGLYVEGSAFWERFKDPADYLRARRQTEQWLRQEFIAKGGDPQETYPIYMMLGRSQWVRRAMSADTTNSVLEIHVPLSIFRECDISFTYPDSMVTLLYESEKNPEYYQPDYHGKLFTLSEIRAIIASKGMPGDDWGTNTPGHLANYVEAQVWNRKLLFEFYESGEKPPAR